MEGIESVSGLIARYTVVEKLYLHQQCESIGGFHEAITKLYAAIFTYLSKVKAYCTGNTWSMYLTTAVKECIYLLEVDDSVLIHAPRKTRSKLERGGFQAV